MKPVRDLMQPHIVSLPGYEFEDPMEIQAQRLGIPSEKVLRANLNENPYGPSPRVMEALADFDEYNRYPDPIQREARATIAEYVSVGPEHIVAGSGADELIDLAMRIFLNPGNKVINCPPTFGMYAFNTGVCGGQIANVPRDASFDVDVEAIREAAQGGAKMLIYASPNNPTGNITTEEDVRKLLALNLMVVVDETYHEFSGHTIMPLVKEYNNLIVLRSFSKWAGLAGLRVGFGVMSPEVVERMLTMKPPYNLSKPAELALKASLEDRELLLSRVKTIVNERERMRTLLEDMPMVTPWPSHANFLLCEVPEGQGQRVYEALLSKGIFIRRYSDSRLKNFIRITAGIPEQTDEVVEALREEMEEAK